MLICAIEILNIIIIIIIIIINIQLLPEQQLPTMLGVVASVCTWFARSFRSSTSCNGVFMRAFHLA